MADLSTKYLGLNLKNPVIAASSGLTKNLHQVQELEKEVSALLFSNHYSKKILILN